MSSAMSFMIMLLSAAGVVIPFIASSRAGCSPLAQCGDIDLEEQHARRSKMNLKLQIFGSTLALLGILLQWWLPLIYQS